jgi:cyclopropane-fatty-acyl-phospholipid synthase
LLAQSLRPLQQDCIRVVDGTRVYAFGGPGGATVTVVVHHPRFYRRVVLGSGLGAAEAWIDGDWSCDDLTRLVRIFIRNRHLVERLSGAPAWVANLVAGARHLWRRNTRTGARRNIHEHYDLGNDFFRLFLDETLSYSCGVFEQPAASLDEASLAKLERVCRKLDLRPSDHLVEIGTGWGGLALYAAGQYGCRVTTTTISAEQHKLASARVAEQNLAGRVQVLSRDYRDLDGVYDKLVSIEMIEAVGYQYFPTFFEQASRLLAPDGRMLLQAIVIRDQFYAAHRHSADFIRQHIFPGGCLPSITALCTAMTQASDLRLVHLEEMSDHYARTLRAWRERFWERREEARALGYTERFLRKWEYYLRYCEAAFEERQVNVVQMLLAKPRCHVDPLAISVPAVESPSALAAAREGNETPPALRPRSAAAPCLKGGT